MADKANRVIKMGIVGCGNSARNIHYPQLNKRQHQFKVVACCDLDKTRAEAIGKLYEAKAYTDLTAFLSHPDMELVLVTTKPPSTHASVGLAALDAGKHVLLEKPMCATHEEGIQLVKKAKKILTVYHNRRWDPEFLELQWAIQQGFFGNIKLFEIMVCGNLLNADWLVDFGVHLFDQALFLGQDKPIEVSCVASFPDDAEGNSGPFVAWMRFNNGKCGIVSMRVGEGGEYPRFSVVGDKGGCAWPVNDGRIKYEDNALTTNIPAIHQGAGKPDLKPGAVRIPFIPFYQNLYEALTLGRELAVKPEEALAVIDVMRAAIQSCKTKLSVVLK